MPSGEVTLQRIQREIYEVKKREEELRSLYANREDGGEISPTNGYAEVYNSSSNNNNNEFKKERGATETSTTKTNNINDTSPPISLGTTNGAFARRFVPHGTTRGIMEKFIKSKGKIAALNALSSTPSFNNWESAATMEETISPPKLSLVPGKQLRKGFVPVEERMKKEFQDMYHRETELKLERRKSQSDLLSMDEEDDVPKSNLRTARSVSHLYDSNEYLDVFQSEQCSLKPARSLAQLCDADDEELEAPGSLTLIRQWESLIQKNQQART